MLHTSNPMGWANSLASTKSKVMLSVLVFLGVFLWEFYTIYETVQFAAGDSSLTFLEFLTTRSVIFIAVCVFIPAFNFFVIFRLLNRDNNVEDTNSI
ncbi:hypothetical protein VST7929_02960 [Vibrio stylophorae]|uniref:Uncharacterized protein n=1 Tax=Vibrio stylophorae TaxID=659351 RepID=A0ABM8ZXD4_9VIBR|nr:hypothetical protein VST7929_02960 [Vibrio stylophorae]